MGPTSQHSGSKHRRIGEMLVEANLVTPEQVAHGLKVQKEKGGKIVENLIALGYIDPDAFVTFLAQQPGIAYIDLPNYEISSNLIDLVPRDFAVEHEVFPIDRMGRLLTVGMAVPLDAATIADLENTTNLRVKPVLVSQDDVRSAIERYYPREAPEVIARPDTPVEEIAPPESSIEGLSAPLKLKNVAKLIREIDTLPALPETVHRVQEATLDPMSSVRDVADIIVMDPPIAGKVLSVANSAFYGFPQRVDDVSLAVTLLGLRETYSIVLSAAVLNVFEKSKVFDYKKFWFEAMCAAAACRVVAKTAGRKHHVGVFTGGLLHDIGRVALAEVVPELYGKVDQDLTGLELVEAEEQIIGICHTEAGYLLAEFWGLPIDIIEPIRFHHKPEHASEAKENVAMVAVADSLAAMINVPFETEEDRTNEVLDRTMPSFNKLGMDREIAEAAVVQFFDLHSSSLSKAGE